MITQSIRRVQYFIFLCLFSIALVPSVFGTMGYTIRAIRVEGNIEIAADDLIDLSGFQKGMVIVPATNQLRASIKKLAKHPSIQTVSIYLADMDASKKEATLLIQVQEHPSMAAFRIDGLSKNQRKQLLEKIDMHIDAVLSPFFVKKTAASIKEFFAEKGYKDIEVLTALEPSKEQAGQATLKITVALGAKSAVHKIILQGNQCISDSILIQQMHELHEAPRFTLVKDICKKIITLAPIRKGGICWQLPKTMEEVKHYFSQHVIFRPAFFTEDKYRKAKEQLIAFYQSKGFRDVSITDSHLHAFAPGKLNIYLNIEEGKQYVIRQIKWIGNYLYSDQALNQWLGLSEGTVYNPLYIQEQLSPGNPSDGTLTISDRYINNGYLFFRAEAVETSMSDNQVDLEIRMHEGKQATINRVAIAGNTITHDDIILRELHTFPGDRFSRARVLDSLRNLAMLKFFKPEALIPEIESNEALGTVDLTYVVEESPKFDCKGSIKYGEDRFMWELEFGSNNASIQKLFSGKMPLGRGQYCAISASWDGKDHKDWKWTFQEPWLVLGGKRYILSLSFDGSFQAIENEAWRSMGHLVDVCLWPFAVQKHKGSVLSLGGRFGLGSKITKYWEWHSGIEYHYNAYENCTLLVDCKKRSGMLHDLSMDFSLVGNSLNHPHYPTRGSSWGNLLTVTPPYGLFANNSGTLPSEISTYKEYAKFMLDTSVFQTIYGHFVLNLRGHIGCLWNFSGETVGPFERFYLGGTQNVSAHSSKGLLGTNFVSLRGYPDSRLTPQDYTKHVLGGVLFNKFVAELRYPLMLAPACIYLLGFMEMGGSWLAYTDYDPWGMKRSLGGGIRIILPIPIVPILGLDIARRLDPFRGLRDSNNMIEYHFTMSSAIR